MIIGRGVGGGPSAVGSAREEGHEGRAQPQGGRCLRRQSSARARVLSRVLMSQNHVFGDISVKLGKIERPASKRPVS
jgi:hypothetical protein